MKRSFIPLAAIGVAAALSITACGQAGQSTTSEDGRTVITMWTHSAGNPAEKAVYDRIIADFNASQESYEVVQEAFPQASYNESVVAAAASGDLPCLLDIDGPIMPNWAWAGYIQPLGISSEITDELLPTSIGVWDGEIYSAGYWEAALGIFARQSVLDANGIRVPTVDEPWSADEFEETLATLQAAGYETAIDIGAEDTGEWWSYAYSPLLQSFGGDLVDRSTMLTADGALNGPEAVAWGEWFQGLFDKGYANTNGTVGNQEFVDDDAALSYSGVWNGLSAVDAVGDDLLILPPPDLGEGPKIGGGSWQWSISSTCNDAEGAREYLEFSFQDEYIAAFADAQAVIPGTEGAAAASQHFGENGVLRPFVEFSQRFAVLRPETPAYAVISSVFEKTAKDVMNGAGVESALDAAVNEIDTNIASNDGYGFQ